MQGKRILLVEDESSIVDVVSQALRRHGFEVSTADNGDDALEMLYPVLPDLVLLDLMLPGMDGWEVCRRIRSASETKSLPIIMMTARRDERDLVQGLGIGADDYIKKPFSLVELVARVKSVIRRTQMVQSEPTVSVGDLEIDLEGQVAKLRGEELNLSLTEYKLLRILAERPGQVVPRERLLSLIWGVYGGDTRTVDVHISRLRKKLTQAGDDGAPAITALRGRGYRLTVEEHHENP
ncbi:MAG: response regulator transcription factor [Dethiosulfovibrio sp.]|nr:response regulator transcription factor [Dethiosulfovibrio sp.]